MSNAEHMLKTATPGQLVAFLVIVPTLKLKSGLKFPMDVLCKTHLFLSRLNENL